MNNEVTLQKDCLATLIPSGDEVTLAEGASFSIAQSLGGSVTLRDLNGLYRVGERANWMLSVMKSSRRFFPKSRSIPTKRVVPSAKISCGTP